MAKDQSARDEMVQKTGRLAVPVVTVGEQVVVGFNRGELEKILQ